VQRLIRASGSHSKCRREEVEEEEEEELTMEKEVEVDTLAEQGVVGGAWVLVPRVPLERGQHVAAVQVQVQVREGEVGPVLTLIRECQG